MAVTMADFGKPRQHLRETARLNPTQSLTQS